MRPWTAAPPPTEVAEQGGKVESISAMESASERRSIETILIAKRAADLRVRDVVAVGGSLPLKIRSIRYSPKVIIDLDSQGGTFELEPDELVCVFRNAN
jgi:hypothetical protein